jgi:hypothetical protein
VPLALTNHCEQTGLSPIWRRTIRTQMKDGDLPKHFGEDRTNAGNDRE